MTPPAIAPQRIARLAPLSEDYAAVDRIAAAIKPRSIDVAGAVGRVLASDVSVEAALPRKPIALRDGWAVSSGLIADAGPYAPVPLTDVVWVETGQPLPAYADAVLPFEALATTGSSHEAIAPASPGEGVIPAGADATPGQPLRRAGEILRVIDVAALHAAGVTQVEVRSPRVDVVSARSAIGEAADFVAPLIASALNGAGATARIIRTQGKNGELEQLLVSTSAEAFITIGGTGAGHGDRTIKTVAQVGSLSIHGMGIQPGETAALGQVGDRPVLMLPGRLDAALAVWLLIGSRLLRRLTGLAERDGSSTAALARKITSTIGIADIVLVRHVANGLEPLAAGHFPLQALTHADGWVLVPPESEGYPAGTIVDLRPLP